MLALVDIWIDIKRRCQPPACFAEDKSVIAQMIVPIAYRNIERHTPK